MFWGKNQLFKFAMIDNFAVGVALVIIAGVALASVVLGIVLGVAWWKLAIVILATIIVTKLLD